jgi:hypothetical protein
VSRVESRKGVVAWAMVASRRFPSPNGWGEPLASYQRRGAFPNRNQEATLQGRGAPANAPETVNRQEVFQPPSISLPRGGAIRGIGEKFAANPVTGTGSLTVPIAVSPADPGSVRSSPSLMTPAPAMALAASAGAYRSPPSPARGRRPMSSSRPVRITSARSSRWRVIRTRHVQDTVASTRIGLAGSAAVSGYIGDLVNSDGRDLLIA